ncbi:murein L,D-transpeptidase [Ekhidna sp.]|uniref:L,D-transpeptidase family protein n=1 Tax=Ekhidna sp. TaxID=2608089 RepID=UPI003511BEF8
MKPLKILLFTIGVISSLALSPVDQDEFIRQKVEMISSGIPVLVGEDPIYCRTVLPRFYQERQFKKAWNDKDAKELIQAVSDADEEGLTPTDYHLELLQKLQVTEKDEIQKAEYDLLLTDAFLLYASHFLNGKINPETVDSEWQAVRREGDAKVVLEEALNKNKVREVLKELAPDHIGYKGLRNALREYRSVAKKGGWESIPAGETLKPGMVDSVRIPRLISRLKTSLDLKQNPADQFTYSEQLAEAVKNYQVRNGLEADGNLGKLTTASLNVPVEDRINQIIINMERYRWAAEEMGSHYVIVNIADYQLQVFKDKKKTFEEKVIVGKPFRKTPVFSSKMSYMVLNPTWTVPPTILFNDILPEAKKDPGYLVNKNIRVLSGQGSNATIIDPYTIDWSTLSKSNFPYTLRQDSGPTNALGAVKFMFPNKYNVYIHDTPSRELFNRTDRAFSSGCIRLNNPLQFAGYLMQGRSDWTLEKIQQAVKEGKEQSVMLKEPLMVHILYLTSWVSEGKVQFRSDLYERDRPILKALGDKPPTI